MLAELKTAIEEDLKMGEREKRNEALQAFLTGLKECQPSEDANKWQEIIRAKIDKVETSAASTTDNTKLLNRLASLTSKYPELSKIVDLFRQTLRSNPLTLTRPVKLTSDGVAFVSFKTPTEPSASADYIKKSSATTATPGSAWQFVLVPMTANRFRT